MLLLDEATSSLDEKTEAMFQRVLEEKFADTTIFCIAHRLETLRWCRTPHHQSLECQSGVCGW